MMSGKTSSNASNNSLPYGQRLVNLDIIRFIAAFSVLIYHYKSKFCTSLPETSVLSQNVYSITKFGYLGVDLFFLISGFVIFASANNRTAIQFLISRATRILPTFWVCLVITTFVLLSIGTEGSKISIFSFLANFFLVHEYVNQPAVDGVYWTLITELKFYACVFLLILLGGFKYYRAWILLWLAATLCFFVCEQPSFMGWFISPYYSPYFISGIIFYLAKKEGYTLYNLLILSISLPLALYNGYITIDSFAKDVSIADKVIADLLICLFFFIFYLISKDKLQVKERRFWLLLGGITYPLYLLHNLMGKVIYDELHEYLPSFILLALITLCMVLASLFIHTKLERRISDRLKSFLIGYTVKLQKKEAVT
ncbi:acyltransferase [Aliikangiella sp. G2MR2-5]|uniref:acyltransferase family protein n=1 Tax=Aliikangiella sp. G2MR2-5 TaxID=2788943 RepID=UPI0018A885A2|nr:acyltransferase [Aliikangiella sp. G2MR2-5]